MLPNNQFTQLLQWILVVILVGGLSGLICSLFSLHLSTIGLYRDQHAWVYILLPLGAFLVQSSYYYSRRNLARGNDLVIQHFYAPKQTIHWLMAPLVYCGTLITHLVGGSAGREGTAVQLGATIAAQFKLPILANNHHRRTVLQMGVASGFSALFGTPIAAIFFSLEMFRRKQIKLGGLLPISLAALFAYYTTHLMGINHSHYPVSTFPILDIQSILWVLLSALLFGLVAMSFVGCLSLFKTQFNTLSIHPILLTILGSLVLMLVFYFPEMRRYSGLGITYIQQSFFHPVGSLDFLLKIVLTTFTLSIGFKGGEVTPLFFIGATLGSFLSTLIPLSTDFLASLGFVTVFGSATKTPLASAIIGIELFGIEGGLFYLSSCLLGCYISGKHGIYIHPSRAKSLV